MDSGAHQIEQHKVDEEKRSCHRCDTGCAESRADGVGEAEKVAQVFRHHVRRTPTSGLARGHRALLVAAVKGPDAHGAPGLHAASVMGGGQNQTHRVEN